MASIKEVKGKKGISYQITVVNGKDIHGKQIRAYKTWTPDADMTKWEIKRQLDIVAAEFEKKFLADGEAEDKTTFAEYSEYVIYYETTLGNLVCFYVTETPDERHENTLYFFVPYDVVEKSAQTWQENISNNNSYTSYYDLFRKYRFQLKIAIS